jgi:dTDP-4-dehydrorhamnose reductase
MTKPFPEGGGVAVVGGAGMLGRDLLSALEDGGYRARALDLPDLDLRRADTIAPALAGAAAVVNCAAFTRVDEAERAREAAYAVNATGAGNLAGVCAALGVRLVHLSTDYVFDGQAGRAYLEGDPVRPINVYGATKLEGERLVARAGGDFLVVRTQSLFGVHGPNFVKSILRQIREGRTRLRVVHDQVSAPTFTRHLAQALVRLLEREATGTVHVASRTGCSWHAFACAIVARVDAAVEVEPIPAASLDLPARRPPCSTLDTAHYTRLTGHVMPTWEEGLDAYLAEEPLARL